MDGIVVKEFYFTCLLYEIKINTLPMEGIQEARHASSYKILRDEHLIEVLSKISAYREGDMSTYREGDMTTKSG